MSSAIETQPVGTAGGADAAPFVRIEGITKRFGAIVAVNRIDLDIQRSELFCLLGGSGSGKSTLLRMLAGFEQPSEGRILIDGQDMTGVPAYERPVNMMFQSYALFPHMSVSDNVAYGLRRGGVPRAEIRKRVADMLDMVKMGDYAQRRPHQLSGGQRQRVALARALVKQPKLLLLDEPLGALDKKLREETQFELMKIQAQLGTTFIVVTHDQDEAMTLASRMGVMRDGRLVQVGGPRDLYEFPADRYVAQFIGAVNLFDGVLIEDEPGHARMRCEEAGCVIHVGHGVTGTLGQTVHLAIRPEKINLAHDRPAQDENVTPGTIDEVAYLGNLSVYQVRLDTGRLIHVTLPNLDRHEGNVFEIGNRVYCSWGPASAVVLPA
ncbi:ABC transporter ATP-binding protein [Mycoplana dimorpha]|uniref:Spermidine/putrescine import ATP-binding protein PotA n=1 Tax=Mycoplana dimorpha TaxID=28320 RepID=A0A2T5B396_MYCDI|nr:ABC transporter ATP-binding protein [Mycoplana dimorpha]PTM93448.1 spermidine/putrescine ABC transporter ATP-binding subunit [Mycoplana dimorpha]